MSGRCDCGIAQSGSNRISTAAIWTRLTSTHGGISGPCRRGGSGTPAAPRRARVPARAPPDRGPLGPREVTLVDTLRMWDTVVRRDLLAGPLPPREVTLVNTHLVETPPLAASPLVRKRM